MAFADIAVFFDAVRMMLLLSGCKQGRMAALF